MPRVSTPPLRKSKLSPFAPRMRAVHACRITAQECDRVRRVPLSPSLHQPPVEALGPFRLSAYKSNMEAGHRNWTDCDLRRELDNESEKDDGRSRYHQHYWLHRCWIGRRGCGECRPNVPWHVGHTVAAKTPWPRRRRARRRGLERARLEWARMVRARVVWPWDQRMHQRHRPVGICHR
jgi:hypothetical protein